MTVSNWLPLFSRPEIVEIVFASWRFLQANSDFEIFGYVIIENHLHLAARSRDLAKDIQRFKSYSAREIIDHLRASGEKGFLSLLEYSKRPYKTQSKYQVWEEGSHPQIIENEAVLRQKLDYIHNNPVRRGYIDEPAHWRYSSARDYAGREGLIKVTREW